MAELYEDVLGFQEENQVLQDRVEVDSPAGCSGTVWRPAQPPSVHSAARAGRAAVTLGGCSIVLQREKAEVVTAHAALTVTVQKLEAARHISHKSLQ